MNCFAPYQRGARSLVSGAEKQKEKLRASHPSGEGSTVSSVVTRRILSSLRSTFSPLFAKRGFVHPCRLAWFSFLSSESAPFARHFLDFLRGGPGGFARTGAVWSPRCLGSSFRSFDDMYFAIGFLKFVGCLEFCPSPQQYDSFSRIHPPKKYASAQPASACLILERKFDVFTVALPFCIHSLKKVIHHPISSRDEQCSPKFECSASASLPSRLISIVKVPVRSQPGIPS